MAFSARVPVVSDGVWLECDAVAKFVAEARRDGEVFTPTFTELGRLTRLLIDLRMRARELDALANSVEQLIEDGALALRDRPTR